MTGDSPHAKSLHMQHFGCRLNAEESGRMQNLAKGLGDGKSGDTYIINSCAVTAEAARQGRQRVKQIARQNPQSKIYVTGCASELDPQNWENLPNVVARLPNAEKTSPALWQKLGATPQAYSPALPNSGRARALVAVQNGCDHRCTFCIIPFGRGASRSTPVKKVIAECQQHLASGFQEIVLTGVDITSYGHDLMPQVKLGDLVEAVLKALPNLPRLRLSSIDPAEMDAVLWDVFAHEPRLLPYWHLSVQAGDDMILKRMKRRHTRQDVLHLCERARRYRKDCTFGADLIAGFPTETDCMFQRTLDLIKEAGLTWLHIFPFSPRQGTPAARMPQLKGPLIAERAKILREAALTAEAQHCQQLLGLEVECLIEQGTQGTGQGSLGRLRDFTLVQLKPEAASAYPAASAYTIGSLQRARIVRWQDGKLHAERIEAADNKA